MNNFIQENSPYIKTCSLVLCGNIVRPPRGERGFSHSKPLQKAPRNGELSPAKYVNSAESAAHIHPGVAL